MPAKIKNQLGNISIEDNVIATLAGISADGKLWYSWYGF